MRGERGDLDLAKRHSGAADDQLDRITVGLSAHGQRRAAEEPIESTDQQIARLTAEAEAAVAQALASGDPAQRAEVAAQIEDQTQWAADGEAEGSPYLALAAHLRTLIARLEGGA